MTTTSTDRVHEPVAGMEAEAWHGHPVLPGVGFAAEVALAAVTAGAAAVSFAVLCSSGLDKVHAAVWAGLLAIALLHLSGDVLETPLACRLEPEEQPSRFAWVRVATYNGAVTAVSAAAAYTRHLAYALLLLAGWIVATVVAHKITRIDHWVRWSPSMPLGARRHGTGHALLLAARHVDDLATRSATSADLRTLAREFRYGAAVAVGEAHDEWRNDKGYGRWACSTCGRTTTLSPCPEHQPFAATQALRWSPDDAYAPGGQI